MPHDIGQRLLNAAVDGLADLGGDVGRLQQRQAHRQTGAAGAGEQSGHVLQPRRGDGAGHRSRSGAAGRTAGRVVGRRCGRVRRGSGRRVREDPGTRGRGSAVARRHGRRAGVRGLVVGAQDVDQGAHLVHSPAARLADDSERGVGRTRIGGQDGAGAGGLHGDDRQAVAQQVVDVAGDAGALGRHGEPALDVLLRLKDRGPLQGPLDALARPAPGGAHERRHRDQRPPGDQGDDVGPRRLGVHEPADAVGGQHRSGVDQGEERRAPGPAHAALGRLGGDQAGGDREDRQVLHDGQVEAQGRPDDAHRGGGVQAPQRDGRAARGGHGQEDGPHRGAPAGVRGASGVECAEAGQEGGEEDVGRAGPDPRARRPPGSFDGHGHDRTGARAAGRHTRV